MSRRQVFAVGLGGAAAVAAIAAAKEVGAAAAVMGISGQAHAMSRPSDAPERWEGGKPRSHNRAGGQTSTSGEKRGNDRGAPGGD